jgi:hypothetical protein
MPEEEKPACEGPCHKGDRKQYKGDLKQVWIGQKVEWLCEDCS